MHVLAHGIHFRHRVDHRIREVIGMRTGESYATDSINGADSTEEPGEIVLAVIV
jgi:hypothetical protein